MFQKPLSCVYFFFSVKYKHTFIYLLSNSIKKMCNTVLQHFFLNYNRTGFELHLNDVVFLSLTLMQIVDC